MKTIITTIIILFSTQNPEPAGAAGVDLCCHHHDDGSVGCWPDATSNIECDGWIDNCQWGAVQTNPNDEESWACVNNRTS